MQFWKASVAGLLTFAGLSLTAEAQTIPSLPPISPPIAGAGGLGTASGASAVSGLAGAAQPRTLWGFLGISKANCQACKEKFCASTLGTMVNSAMAPMGAMTGGLIGPCCPTVPTAAQVAALANGPGGPNGAAAVAAKIKADEADAKARVAAVEYLGTVDCKRWPAAEKALVNALRGDTNECVRYAAARVMNNGCCCTKVTIDALKDVLMTVKPTDALPVETSERVRAAAMVALSRCQFLNPEQIETPIEDGEIRKPTPPPPPVTGERAPGTASIDSSDPDVRLTAYINEVKRKPAAQVLAEARRELENARRMGPPPLMTTGNRSLMQAIVRSRSRTPVQEPVYARSNTEAVPAQVVTPAPAMTPVPSANYAPTPIEADPSVVGTSATMPAPTDRRPNSGGKSLSDIFARSRNRSGQ